MSIPAINWCLKQELEYSSTKFVLVALANYADEYGCCYPSIERICSDTCQNRKTVIASLGRLEAAGLLKDTGQRVGLTRSVPVYQICGIPENASVHYVYRLTRLDTGEFYIGKRSFTGDPDLDSYRGSGAWCMEMAEKRISLHREVLARFESHDQCIAEEQRLLRLYGDDPKIRNKGTPQAYKAAGIKQSLKRDSSIKEAVPNFPEAVPNFPEAVPKTDDKQSLKRDPEPSVEPSIEPPHEPSSSVGVVDKESLSELKPHLNTPRVMNKWQVWMTHRRAFKKPKSWLVLFNEQIEWLGQFDEPTAFEILSTSIRNGYQGLFEPKNRNETHQSNTSNGARGDRRTVADERNSRIMGAAAVRTRIEAEWAKAKGAMPPGYESKS